jgi:hypothetical protein
VVGGIHGQVRQSLVENTGGRRSSGDRDSELARTMDEIAVDPVLIEMGRPRRNSPIWKGKRVMVVVSLDGWRESPPANWMTSRHRVGHAQLGGMTEGEFLIHIAHRGPFEDFEWCKGLPGVPAKLMHVLTCTGSGRKVPVPEGIPDGRTSSERLIWEQRFDKIATPTVFYKDSWVKRRLELKELKGMLLDIPVQEECGSALRARMKEMRMPGKIYGALLSEVSRGFAKARRLERKRPLEEVEAKMTETAKEVTAEPIAKDLKSLPEAESSKQTNTAKATKADDVLVPVFLMNEAVCQGGKRLNVADPKVTGTLDVLRQKFLLTVWKRKVTMDLVEWLHVNRDRLSPEELEKCEEAGKRALAYSGKASWWKWNSGSYPFFWRWPEEYQKEIRDGLAPRFSGVPPRCEERQRVHPDPDLGKKEKINKVISFGYLVRTCWEGLKSLMRFFSVVKGGTDIWMVYNGTKSGLNLVTWVPWFVIPSSATLE